MTTPSSTDSTDAQTAHETESSDQVHYHHQYRHGRMPFFMKILWLGFLVFGAWYVSTYLLAALQSEVG